MTVVRRDDCIHFRRVNLKKRAVRGCTDRLIYDQRAVESSGTEKRTGYV